jgi:pimeloyl-ACP methyl ester carboxylesterase
VPYATNEDVHLYFETFGDPSDPALLLVNGLGSQCINYKEDWCALFAAEGFHVIRFDNRDVGLSTHLSTDADPPYLLADMARDAIAVLDAVVGSEGRAHVIGLSMGGMIVQQMAIDNADRLLSMTSVMSTTGDPDVGQPSDAALAALVTPAPPDREGAIQRYIDNNHIYGSPAFLDDERLRQNAALAFDRDHDPAGVARQMKAIMASGSRSGALGSVATPTLVIHGDADQLVDVSGGRRTAEVIPGARLEIIEGMGHDYPPELWERLVSLVAGHARSAGRMPA